MSDNRRLIGSRGEETALAFLLEQGYHLLEKNYRCRLGEIDLILEDGPEVVFVEVKTRRSSLFGMPQEAVGLAKQTRIRRLAQFYLLSKKDLVRPLRFDVIAIMYSGSGEPEIQHLKGVF